MSETNYVQFLRPRVLARPGVNANGRSCVETAVLLYMVPDLVENHREPYSKRVFRGLRNKRRVFTRTEGTKPSHRCIVGIQRFE